MQTITLNLTNNVAGKREILKPSLGADIKLSLKPFIDYIKKRAELERTSKSNFYKYIIQQFNQYPELQFPIAVEDAEKYTELYELIYTALSPIINDENQQFWALGTPLSGCFHYGTDAFYNVLMDQSNCSIRKDLDLPSRREMEKNMLSSFYNIILDRFYNISMSGNQVIVNSIVDKDTHLLKYYRLNVDTRFLDVKANVELPDYNLKDVKDYIKDERNTLKILTKLIPPEIFSISGISVITLTDVTSEYALESIKNLVIEHSDSQKGQHPKDISIALKTLVGTDQIDFGLVPYLKLNNKLQINEISGFTSILIQLAKDQGNDEEQYEDLIEQYLLNPRTLIFPEITTEEYANYPMLKLLGSLEITSYALFPLYYNGKLVGCLELYTKKAEEFNGSTLTKIEAAFPLLAQ
ncbi:MAG: GAF domain-containing protein, partial [Pedobacter sp.]